MVQIPKGRKFQLTCAQVRKEGDNHLELYPGILARVLNCFSDQPHVILFLVTGRRGKQMAPDRMEECLAASGLLMASLFLVVG